MPLTLSRRHLGMVSANDYVILEKSDGTRYMLFAATENVYLIDRLMRVFAVEPNPLILGEGFRSPQSDTILDGELTFNVVLERWEYLIYDCVSIDGDLTIAQRGFRERMRAAEMFVAGPRSWAPFCSGLLRLRIKDYYEKLNIRKLFCRIKKDEKGHYMYINNDRRDGVMCNENDGTIFAPVGIGYQVRKCEALLKWKPPHLNSIDFTLQLERTFDRRRNNEPSVRPFVAYKGEKGLVRLREVYFPSRLKRKWAADFDKFHNCVVELAYDKGAGEWRYIRTREDKDSPNFSSTVIDTMETIAESMEREELVAYMEKHARPAPSEQNDLLQGNAQNEESCTFRNDYFDESNHDYLLTTPISLITPPFLRPPPGSRFNRGRRPNHARHVANGGDNPTERQSEDGGRSAVEYEDDV